MSYGHFIYMHMLFNFKYVMSLYCYSPDSTLCIIDPDIPADSGRFVSG